MTPPQQPAGPGRIAGNTLIVIVVLVGLFCALPLAGCGVMVILGNIR